MLILSAAWRSRRDPWLCVPPLRMVCLFRGSTNAHGVVELNNPTLQKAYSQITVNGRRTFSELRIPFFPQLLNRALAFAPDLAYNLAIIYLIQGSKNGCRLTALSRMRYDHQSGRSARAGEKGQVP